MEKQSKPVRAFVESINGYCVSGWASSKNPQTDQPAELEFFEGQEYLGSCLAEIPRADINGQGARSGGFFFAFTTSLSEDRLDRIRVLIKESRQDVPIGESARLAGENHAKKQTLAPIPKKLTPWLPSKRSKFGGLWTDSDNALETLSGKKELSWISQEEYEQLQHWIDHGFAILPQVISHEKIDRLLAEWEEAISGKTSGLWTESFENGEKKFKRLAGATHEESIKFLDLYSTSEAARSISLDSSLVRFLSLIFDRPPLAFQSLSFWNGTEQPVHQDTAYVKVSPPMELAASWVALEDVKEGSGELEYYPGSHRFADFEWSIGGKWKMGPLPDEQEKFASSLHKQASDRGLKLKKFRPQKGDVLIWSADLAHGGSKRINSETRKSLVTHYCPSSCNPAYFYSSNHSPKKKYNSAYYCHEIRSEE